MGRSIKERCITCVPVASYYKPVGIPMRNLDEIALAMDELEAMRLTDLEGLYQADAAERMGVSRQTIGNLLNRAPQGGRRAAQRQGAAHPSAGFICQGDGRTPRRSSGRRVRLSFSTLPLCTP